MGTATAWTAIALALADPQRQVVTYDLSKRPSASATWDALGLAGHQRGTLFVHELGAG